MTEYDRLFLDRISARLLGQRLSLGWILARIRNDGGIDVENLSDDDILKLLEGSFSGDWHEPAFSFGELLAGYSAWSEPPDQLSNDRIIAWIFSVFVIGDAIAAGEADLILQFPKILDVCARIKGQLDADECIFIFKRLFQTNNGVPATAEYE